VLLSVVCDTPATGLVPESDVALFSELLGVADEYCGVFCCDTLVVGGSSFEEV